MAIPTSALFSTFDWNSRAASTADAGDATVLDTTNGLLAAAGTSTGFYNQTLGVEGVADSTGLILVSPALATLKYASTVPDAHTFEFDVSFPDDLPDDFSDQDNRVFIGAVAATGQTSGFLFSKKGIALAASPFSEEKDVDFLAGSADKLYEAGSIRDTITIRSIVDSTTKVATIYITDTADCYETDTLYGSHNFAYTATAPTSTLGEDQLLVAVRSKDVDAGRYTVRLKSVRLTNGSVSTPDSPVAYAEFVDTVNVGRRVRLDGRNSYDPEGAALTYHWEIEEYPKGATLDLRGGVKGAVTLGVAASDNQITFTAKRATVKEDTRRVKLKQSSAANAPLKVTVADSGDILITLGTAASAITTTPLNIIDALTKPNSVGYNADAAALVTPSLPTGQTGLGACVEDSGALAGGKGSTRSLTSLHINKAGIYRFSLRVSNGERISKPEIVTVQALLDSQLLGHRPNSEYLFMGLSDFWNLVNDKAMLSTAWSAASQVISGELLKLLQNDYGKSITDISRKYQRRWLSYRMRIPVPVELQKAPKQASGAHYFVKPDTAYIEPNSGNESFATTVNSGTLVNPDTGAAVTIKTTPERNAYVTILNASGAATKAVIGAVGETSPYSVQLTTKAINAVEKIDYGNYGTGFVDSSAPAGDNSTSFFTIKDTALKIANIKVGDLLVMEYDGTVISRTITVVDALDPVSSLPLENTIQFDAVEGKIRSDGELFKWQIVRKVSYCQLFQHPYFSLGANVDLRPLRFNYGDIAEVTYKTPGGEDELTAQIPIIHTTSNEVFVDWRFFFEDLNTALTVVNSGAPAQAYSPSNPQGVFLDMQLRAIIRTEKVPLREDVVSIPQMGESTVYADLAENKDYVLSQSLLTMEAQTDQKATVVAGDNKVYLTTALSNTDNIFNVIVTEGEIGNFPVLDVAEDGKTITVDHIFSAGGSFNVRIPKYGYNATVPKTLWAEVTYFDNWKTIEGNFGILAGLPKSMLDDANVDIDYKSIVQACWFAFMSGPQVANLKLAAQAFMGLPYSDVAGQVTVINPNHSATEGRIVVKQPGRAGYSTFFYPNTYDIAKNPDTSRQIKAATLKFSQDYKLTKDQQDELAARIADSSTPADKVAEYTLLLNNAKIVDDATIPAYTALVDAVQVFDYVSEPDKIATILTGSNIITRTHCFVVQIPSSGLSNLNFLPILKDFVNEWKPAHTAVIFFGGYTIVEDINVEESLKTTVTLKLADSAHTFQVVKDSDNTKTWPTDRTDDNNPDTPTWDYTDVVEKFESSYVAGVLDDYSGDGSWNSTHSIVDMINEMDSDYDVINSFMWVPIEVTSNTTEFQLDEEVELLDNTNTVITGVGWDTGGARPGGAPRIVHIGSGVHPKIPFGVHSPQVDHPHTYLLLGFYNDAGTNNSGSTNRLRALQGYPAATTIKVRGKTSLAIGNVKPTRDRATARVDATSVYPDFDKAIDPDDADYLLHKPYFILENVYALDKLLVTGPRIHTEHMVTQYVPVGGLARGGGAPELDQNAFVINDLQVQCHPFDATINDDEQKVPSNNPGYFTNWNNEAAAGLLEWGWTGTAGVDPGELDQFNTHTLFHSDASHADIENLHIGRRVKVWKDAHVTHGFIDFIIPGPQIRLANPNPGPLDWRIEGYYFVDVDPTMVNTPDENANSFDGTKGGTWVFFKNQSTGVETPADIVNFETGFNATKTVLGIPGAQQTSTGHVLLAHVASLPAQGWYDIIVRNYRPYVFSTAAPTTLYHMDEDTIEGVLYYNPPAGFGGGGFGAAPFGGP